MDPPSTRSKADRAGTGQAWDAAVGSVATEAARRFATAWRAGRHPKIDEFLLDLEPDQKQGVLLALLRAELNLRREAGERATAEEYLERHPEADAETRVGLIYEEFCLRAEAGSPAAAEEYYARFPELVDRLRRVLEIHDLFDSAGSNFSWASSSSSASTHGSSRAAFPKVGDAPAGFRLVEELGRGSFARVYRAEEERLGDRPVALKVARVDSNEPLMLARLQHTHIVPIYSYHAVEENRLHLICMPYFGKTTLARVLADSEARAARSGAELAAVLDRLDPSTNPGPGRRSLAKRSYAAAVAWWGACMAEALEHAHERGVLHRDVKPSNVLITTDGLPMLLDFNLSRGSILDDREAGPDLLGGTFAYMSPEHLESVLGETETRVDARGDIYSLGIILYEMLTGSRPFSNPAACLSAWGILREAIVERKSGVDCLRHRHPEIPPAMDAIVRKCLAGDRERRYRNAGELAADLRAAADEEPLRFAREPLFGRLCRRLKRKPREWIALGLAIVVVSGVLIRRHDARVEQARRAIEIDKLIEVGGVALDSNRPDLAAERFRAAAELAQGDPELASLEREARSKARLSSQTAEIRARADRFLKEVDELRLPAFGRDARRLADADRVLSRFYILQNPDWYRLADLSLLDFDRRSRLIAAADDLLFLRVFASLGRGGIDARTLTENLKICDRAPAFSALPRSWRALRSRAASSAVQLSPTGLELELEPIEAGGSPRGCFRAALLFEYDGRIDEAVAQMQEAVKLDPGDYWSRLHLARLLFLVGRIDEAREQGRTAIAIDRRRPEAPRLLKGLLRAAP